MIKILLIVLIAVLVTVYVIRWQSGQYAGFLADSYKVTGEVVGRYEWVVDPKNQRKERQVEYRYTARDGSEQQVTEALEYADLWELLTPGDKIEVYVSNTNPGKAFLAVPMDRRMKIGGQ